MRILIYSHDTYGLGHLRRSLLIAEELIRSLGAAVLIVTGSPRAGAFELPAGCDTVKLPSVLKDGAEYRSRTLPLPVRDVLSVRARLLGESARAFRPDVILVDHAPAGVGDELRPLLECEALRPDRPRIVLGLRDIIDDAAGVAETWTRGGIWDLIDRVYDRVLVYGDPDMPTTAGELDLEGRFPGRVLHVGYLGRRMEPHAPSVRHAPRIVVTVGGGGDGQDVLRNFVSYLETLPAPAPFHSLILTGPFLSQRRYQEISLRLRRLGHGATLRRFVSGADRWIRGAAAVISMCGYNTAVEVLASRVPALFVPRERPRVEQRLRAERLAARGAADWCRAGDLDPDRIAQFVSGALGNGAPGESNLRLDGLARVGEAIADLVNTARVGGETHARVR